MEIYNENSEKVKSAKTGTFTTQIISISKTSGSKYIPADRPVNESSNYKTYPKWSMKMQEIVTTDGIYITYNETEWTINEFKFKRFCSNLIRTNISNNYKCSKFF